MFTVEKMLLHGSMEAEILFNGGVSYVFWFLLMVFGT
jgi:hypothetical protein